MRAAIASTVAAFLIDGIGLAAWAPLVPRAQARLALSDGSLGSLLLCLGAGSIVAMPLAGAASARFGARAVLGCATALVCATLPALAGATSAPALGAALVLFGAGIGAVDVAMNLRAVAVERARGAPTMSAFHASFSLGGILSACATTALLASGAPPLAAACAADVAMALLLAAAWPGLRGRADGPAVAAFARPRRPVLGIAALCFVAFLAEGAALDWGGVLLVRLRHLPQARAGLGYAAFQGAMAAGRLCGDALVARAGVVPVASGGATLAALGLAVAATVPSAGAGILGLGLLGAGCANLVPILFSAAGRVPGVAPPVAIASIGTLGYAGMLAGPAAIGWAARAAGLPAALLGVCVGLLGIAAAIGGRARTRAYWNGR